MIWLKFNFGTIEFDDPTSILTLAFDGAERLHGCTICTPAITMILFVLWTSTAELPGETIPRIRFFN